MTEEQTTKIFKTKSATDPKKIYFVRLLLPSGEWRCNCPYFIFNEGRMRAKGFIPKCNHIRRVRHEKLKVSGRPIYKRRHYAELEARRQQFDYQPQQ